MIKLDPLTPCKWIQLAQENVEMPREEFEKLRAAVERNETVDGSAATLIEGLSTQMRTLADNGPNRAPELKDEIRALADKMDASTARLSAAVMAGTGGTPGTGGGFIKPPMGQGESGVNTKDTAPAPHNDPGAVVMNAEAEENAEEETAEKVE